jgi:hypothetical protein
MIIEALRGFAFGIANKNWSSQTFSPVAVLEHRM